MEPLRAGELYRRKVAEWLEGGRQDLPTGDPLRVTELAFKLWTFAEGFYRKPDGTPTSSLDNDRMALCPLKRLYGSMFVSEFGPLCLKTIRADLITGGLARKTVNELTGLIRRVFRWGVGERLVPASVHHALQAVEGLRRGRSEARETDPVRPVPEQEIEAIRPHVSRQVWALVQLQLLTGARPGELLALRPVDLDTSGKVWTYRPADHKTAWHGHGRTIYFGPKARRSCGPSWLARCTPTASARPRRRPSGWWPCGPAAWPRSSRPR